MAADCQLVSDEGRRQLRSAASRTYVVRRTYSNYLFQLQIRNFGTAFQLISDKLALNFIDLNGYSFLFGWKRPLNKSEGHAYFHGKLFVCPLGIPHTKLHTKFEVSSSSSFRDIVL